MSSYIIGSCTDFEKWEKQNNATIIDCSEGCLLDSLVYETKRGTAFFFEHYLNANSSGYLFMFFPYSEQENNEEYIQAWNDFNNLQTAWKEGNENV